MIQKSDLAHHPDMLWCETCRNTGQLKDGKLCNCVNGQAMTRLGSKKLEIKRGRRLRLQK